MGKRASSPANDLANGLQSLPLDAADWQAICAAMRLSPTQSKIVELTLRDACDKQIAAILGISDGTLKTHQKRISFRTATRGRMQLAMRVLAISHEIAGNSGRPPNG